MSKSAQEIYDEIVAHIKKEGGALKTWYSGITSDIDTRLFGDHNVPRKDHWFIWRQAYSSNAARDIEKALIRLGTDGGTGGGDSSADCVYCYKKSSITNP